MTSEVRLARCRRDFDRLSGVFAIDLGVPAVLRMAVEGLRATGIAALVGGSPPGSELKVDMLTYVVVPAL